MSMLQAICRGVVLLFLSIFVHASIYAIELCLCYCSVGVRHVQRPMPSNLYIIWIHGICNRHLAGCGIQCNMQQYSMTIFNTFACVMRNICFSMCLNVFYGMLVFVMWTIHDRLAQRFNSNRNRSEKLNNRNCSRWQNVESTDVICDISDFEHFIFMFRWLRWTFDVIRDSLGFWIVTDPTQIE